MDLNIEAATMLLLSNYEKLMTEKYTSAVVLGSENTDVHIQAAFVSH